MQKLELINHRRSNSNVKITPTTNLGFISSNSIKTNYDKQLTIMNKPLQRAQTPHVDMISIRELNQQSNDMSLRSFNSFFKQIIESNNEHFLNGEINIIDYLISKYSNISVTQGEVQNLDKLSIKIQSDLGMLNQFGTHLPKLVKLSLNGSVIPSIGDIGSNFVNLRVLNISNCFLEDLNGKYNLYYLNLYNFRFTLL